ncbi:cbb3-type cytochrome c oxidase subunit 3 [Sulfitobacter sp.]|jgi:cytochrome c oxidase cbb3-type subunit 4|uniref:cbb3-type cytochrome c oxidase subunit 3 n=1 Tax=Sulfitobacter sp. TaxID=1903071 RepID=UPI003001A644
MDTYSFLRELADSWILLAMFGFFAGAAIWAFLPSQSSAREEASMIPFRKDGEDSAGLGPKGMSRNMEAKSHD